MSDDERTLWVGTNNGATTLHVARDCKSLARSDARPATPNERRTFERCGLCTTKTPTPANERRRCPKCNDTFGTLPTHMRRCDGGDNDE